jgi:hypothetical protein
VLNHIVFDNDNNYIHINIYTLTLGANCTISNQSDKRFFITNDAGFLKKKSINKTAFIFPVGFNNSNFNPVTISENGTAADYEVRCLEHAYKNGSSGNIISANGIDVSWNINRSTTTGTNATISAKWKNADELTGFNSAKCLLVKYDGTSWNYNANLAGSASGSPYKSISRSNLTSFGYFTVLSSSNTSFANAVDALIANDAELKVYPTIVRNSFNISVPFNKNIQKMNIMVLDGAGKIVWQKQNADFQSQQISLPSLASGMYTVLINYDDKNFTQKIVINQ